VKADLPAGAYYFCLIFRSLFVAQATLQHAWQAHVVFQRGANARRSYLTRSPTLFMPT
jgi:hypothetical protein